jgi:hypothetical protein
VAEANDLSLAEHAARLVERTGVTASGPTVGPATGAAQAGAAPGKKTLLAHEPDRADLVAARAAWRANLAALDPRRPRSRTWDHGLEQ